MADVVARCARGRRHYHEAARAANAFAAIVLDETALPFNQLLVEHVNALPPA